MCVCAASEVSITFQKPLCHVSCAALLQVLLLKCAWEAGRSVCGSGVPVTSPSFSQTSPKIEAKPVCCPEPPSPRAADQSETSWKEGHTYTNESSAIKLHRFLPLKRSFIRFFLSCIEEERGRECSWTWMYWCRRVTGLFHTHTHTHTHTVSVIVSSGSKASCELTALLNTERNQPTINKHSTAAL